MSGSRNLSTIGGRKPKYLYQEISLESLEDVITVEAVHVIEKLNGAIAAWPRLLGASK